MREFKQIAVALIADPAAPMRIEMDDEKFLELVEDVKRQGVLEPLIVYPVGDGYQIIAGHRRLLAARQAGIDSVPCMVHTDEGDNHLGIMIAENLFREDVTAVEEGELFKRVSEVPGITEVEIVRICHKPIGYVYARIALVNGDPDVAMAVHQRKISLGVAQELNKVKDLSFRRVYLEQALQGGCTIEVAKQMVARYRLVNAGLTPAQLQPLEPLPSPEHVAQGTMCRICNSDDNQHEIEPIWVHRSELYAWLTAVAQVRAQEAARAAGG